MVGSLRGYVRVISTCYLGLGHCICFLSFPGGSVVKNSLANAGDARDVGLIPVSGRSPGEGSGNPLQYSCLEHSMDREAWQATVFGVTKSWTQLGTHTHTHTHTHTCVCPHAHMHTRAHTHTHTHTPTCFPRNHVQSSTVCCMFLIY